MDVVNSEIKQLGGSLHIQSRRHEGTSFTVRLPFTLAVNHALLVHVGEDVYAIPLSSIDGVMRVDGRDVDVATQLLQEELARLQGRGELRSDFDPGAMAVAIRAAIDVAPHRLVLDPDFDIDKYASEIADIFDRATRIGDTP
jgi:hypothetical protein